MGAFGMQVSGVPVKIAIPAKCVTNRISTAGMTRLNGSNGIFAILSIPNA